MYSLGNRSRERLNGVHPDLVKVVERASQLAEPNQSTDWADYTFNVTAGDVPCPIKWRVAE